MSPTIKIGLRHVDERVLLAIALVALSTLFFAACDVAAKFIQHEASAEKIAWWRFFSYAAVAIPFALWREGGRVFSPAHPRLNVLRGLTSISSTTFFLLGLSYMTIPDATSIAFVAPIFVMALSIVFLGEVVGIRRWLAAVFGFLGVLVIVQPGTSGFQAASLFTVVSAFLGAGSSVLTRRMARDSAEIMMFWTSAIGLTVCTLIVAPTFTLPSWHEAVFGIAGGLCFAGGQILVVFAYRVAPASLLAPFSYLQMISAIGVSFLIWGIVPSFTTTVGAAMIVASGLYSLHRERVRARDR